MDDDLLATANALRAATGALRRRVRDDGYAALTPGEVAILSRLDRGGPATTATLARLEGITPQALGATAAGLVARGLVLKTADPDDRRRALLTTSPEGVRVLREARDAVVVRIAAALGEHFSAEQVAVIRAAAPLVERLAHVL